MKVATLEQLERNVAGFLEDAQSERVLVTRDGEPVAVLVGIQYKDEEDFHLEASPEFWRMIEERRQRPSVPFEEVLAELFPDEADKESSNDA